MTANVVLRFVLLYGVPAAALDQAAADVTAALAAGDLTGLPVHKFPLDRHRGRPRGRRGPRHGEDHPARPRETVWKKAVGSWKKQGLTQKFFFKKKKKKRGGGGGGGLGRIYFWLGKTPVLFVPP